MFSQGEDYHISSNSGAPANFAYSFQNKSPTKKSPLANLYDQLRETNQKLKEGGSQANSILLGDSFNESGIQRTGNFNKLKEEEIRRMRDEKLEKIRNENQYRGSKSPEKRVTIQEPTNVYQNNNNPRDTSPKFIREVIYQKILNDKIEEIRKSPSREMFYKGMLFGKEATPRELDDQSINIARDYMIYSPNKINPQTSVSQQDFFTPSEEELYPQVKFYKRQKDRDQAYKMLQDQVNDDIKRLANSKKMGQNSYKIMIRKLEALLSSVLLEVDKTGKKLISFEQLGRIFNLLEIFRVIQYDENCNLQNGELFLAGNAQDQKRRFNEMVIHEEVWKVLAENEDSDYVDAEILLDPANLSPNETVKILQEYIEKYRKNTDKENDNQDINTPESWHLEELVKNFKKLIENRLYYNKTGYLKPEKVEEVVKKNKEYTFKPKISPLSQAIDRYHTQRFLVQNVEKKPSSPSPQQTMIKENLDNFLFDLKGNQNVPQRKGESKIGNTGGESILKERGNVLDTSKNVQEDPIENRVKIIYKKHEVSEKRKEEMRKQKELEAMKDCTFQPSIKNYKDHSHRSPNETVSRLYNHHRIKKKKEEERIMEQIEKETREMEECTFKPNINNAGVLIPKDLPKGFEKNVIRMRYATDEAKKKKEALEKIPLGENYEKLKKAKIKPFSFLENPKQKRNPPFVYIEINVAPGRTGRIGIHEDDDPRVLAKNFGVAFQITEDMERNLEEIITQQLQDHFIKQCDNME